MTTEYGASYFGVRNRTHAETDLERFEDAGLNAVLHTFSERDKRYYEETMQDIVASSKDRGFEVYVNPWSVGRVFGGEALSQFIGEHPESQQVTSEGQRIAAACFNAPDFREYMREWTESAAGLGADVLFWDEPHWFLPEWFEEEFADDEWGCRCEHCQARYEDTYGEPMPEEVTDRVQEFKADQLMDFLEEMMAISREEGCENAVCLLPSEDADHGLSDWDQLAASEYLDVLVTDPYWGVFPEAEGPEEFVGYFSEKVADMAEEYDLRGQIWIQGFRLPAGSTEEVKTATRTAIESGVDSVMLWGYDGCKSISDIACEEPEDVWNGFLEEVQAAQE
ncbi:hypothetical protein [Salinarchaeum laminariae]|uniref:hypothetical protein n=1 Tax=Salinarchaeum laminariae TaxID=869888 RepID=UPI0020C174BA|nr:hypothetical protein [Salinarchaeum laminariae]